MKLFTFLFAATFMLLGCTETVYEEILKTDTVFLARPSFVQLPATRDTVVIRDTVTVTIVQHDTIINNIHTVDTVFQVVTKDSLIIKVVEKEVFIRDTIVVTNTVKETITLTDTVTVVEYETRVVYLNTEYVYIFPGNSTTFIPEPLRAIHQSFFDECQKRNKQLPGGDLVISYVAPGELPGDGWNSYSELMAGSQWVIYVNDQLTVEQTYTLLYRELGRIQLAKKYSQDPNKIMSPIFDPSKLRSTDSDAKKAPYLTELFR